MMDVQERYVELMRRLALQATERWAAGDVGEQSGDSSVDVTCVLPAMKVLLAGAGADDAVQLWTEIHGLLHWAQQEAKDTDRGMARVMLASVSGERRTVYFPLVLSVMLAAAEQLGQGVQVPGERMQRLREAIAAIALQLTAEAVEQDPEASGLHLMQGLLVGQATKMWSCDELRQQAQASVDAVLARVPAGRHAGSLQPLAPGESLDAWWYRELVGMHALDQIAELAGRSDWRQRCDQAAMYHLANTQPDNSTTQPWGVSAFVRLGDGITFADQQLHDATFQGGGTLGVIPALLLTQASIALK